MDEKSGGEALGVLYEFVGELMKDRVISDAEIGNFLRNNRDEIFRIFRDAKEMVGKPIEEQREKELQKSELQRDEDLGNLADQLQADLEAIARTSPEAQQARADAETEAICVETARDAELSKLELERRLAEHSTKTKTGAIDAKVESEVNRAKIARDESIRRLNRETKEAVKQAEAIRKRISEGGSPITDEELDDMASQIENLNKMVTNAKTEAIQQGIHEKFGFDDSNESNPEGVAIERSRYSGDVTLNSSINRFRLDNLPKSSIEKSDVFEPIFGYRFGISIPDIDVTVEQTAMNFGLVLMMNRQSILMQITEKARYIEALMEIHKFPEKSKWHTWENAKGFKPDPITMQDGSEYDFVPMTDCQEAYSMLTRFSYDDLKAMQDEIRRVVCNLQIERIDRIIAKHAEADTPEKILEEVVRKENLGAPRLAQFMMGKVLDDAPLRFSTSVEQWLDSGLDAEMPKVMQILYVEEALRQAGLAGRPDNVNYRVVQDVLDTATSDDKIRILDEDMLNILNAAKTITDPLERTTVDQITERLRQLHKHGLEAQARAETRARMDTKEAREKRRRAIAEVKEEGMRKVVEFDARKQAVREEAELLLDDLESKLKTEVEVIVAKESKALRKIARTQHTEIEKRFNERVGKINDKFDVKSREALKPYETIISKAEESYINVLLDEKTSPAERVTKITSSEGFLEGTDETLDPQKRDRLLYAIVSGSTNPLTEGAPLDVKKVLHKIGKGRLKPLPDSLEARFF